MAPKAGQVDNTPLHDLCHEVYAAAVHAYPRTLRIPFLNAEHAVVAKRALDVDREVNAGLVERTTEVEGEVLVVYIHAATLRILRLATNAFLSSADLVLRTMADFAPDPDAPQPTDDELAAIAAVAKEEGGGHKGIELR